jgi:alkylhydroperoxidase family enzyme
MLGRSVGLTDEQIAHLGDEPLPDALYEPADVAIIHYAQASTRLQPITDELYGDLAAHFDTKQIMELCATVGLSNQVNRFHATFLTDVDEAIGDALGSSCPLPLPPRPMVRPDGG